MPNSYLEWADEDGQIRHLEVVDKIFIGRSCRGIEASKRIIAEDPRVSWDHAIISTTGLGLQITDMSKNSVWVNDVRVAPRSSQGLKDGDVIRIGDARYPAAEGLPMGCGITTGKVTMAYYSSRAADLALVGDVTNLAFRLSSMANKDFATPIVMCTQTADLVQDTLSLVDLGFFLPFEDARGRSIFMESGKRAAGIFNSYGGLALALPMW